MRRWIVILAMLVIAAYLIGLRTGPAWTTGQTVQTAHQVHSTR
jgi:hypothetical protein